MILMFQITDILKNDLMDNSNIGGTLRLYHRDVYGNCKLHKKYDNVLGFWDSTLHSWITKWGAEGDRYIRVLIRPVMGYDLYLPF